MWQLSMLSTSVERQVWFFPRLTKDRWRAPGPKCGTGSAESGSRVGARNVLWGTYRSSTLAVRTTCNKLFDKLFAQDGADDPGVTVKSDWDGTLTMDWSTVQTVSAHGITEETQVKLVKVEGCPAVGTGAPW
jgi:hypothetical protein